MKNEKFVVDEKADLKRQVAQSRRRQSTAVICYDGESVAMRQTSACRQWPISAR